MATDSVKPLVIIAGPTASGKTALAIELAKKHHGEIICADSRTIYKGMDIGTAKPTLEEQSIVPHWGLDLVEPGAYFSVADFKAYAQEKVEDIRSRGRLPVVVGGTGLYVDALMYDFRFGPVADWRLRQRLESLSIDDLVNYCHKHNVTLPDNIYNKRYLIRAIESNNSGVVDNTKPINNLIVVAIATDKTRLRTRIELRAEQIFSNGVVKEATALASKYGWESEAMTGNVYPLVKKYIEGDLSRAELEQASAISDWRLAKRQMTWLRRNPHLVWADLSSAEHYLSDQLAKE